MSNEKRGGRSSGKSSKSAGKKASVPGAAEPAAGGKKAAEPAAGGKKISLPAYGFARDLLPKKESLAVPADPPAPADAGEEGEEQASGDEPEAAVADRGEGAGVSEDRIFAFADGLETGSDEAAPAPVRLETWVSFALARETFALPVDPVHEVVRMSSITRVPHAPFPIRGVTNLRGRVVPVIDLRIRLELPEGEITRSSRIVVVGSRGRRLGLLVDAVYQVIHIDLDRVQPPPDDVMTVQSDYIAGVYHLGEELVLLLDVDRVLIIKEASPAGPVPASAEGEAAKGAGRQGAA